MIALFCALAGFLVAVAGITVAVLVCLRFAKEMFRL